MSNDFRMITDTNVFKRKFTAYFYKQAILCSLVFTVMHRWTYVQCIPYNNRCGKILSRSVEIWTYEGKKKLFSRVKTELAGLAVNSKSKHFPFHHVVLLCTTD